MKTETKRVPLNEQDLSLLDKPPLSESFPVIFNKGVTYTQLSAFCLGCDEEIQDKDLHGEVTSVLPTMKQVEARGYFDILPALNGGDSYC